MKRIKYLMQLFFEGKAAGEEQQEFMRMVNSRKFDKLFLKAWEELLEKNLERGEMPDQKLAEIVQNIRKRFNIKDYEYIRTLSEDQNSNEGQDSNENQTLENKTLGPIRIIQPGRRRRVILWSAAAAVLLLVSLTYIAKNYLIPESQPSLTQTLIEPGIKGATLIMDDGTVVALSDTNAFSIREKDGTLIQKEAGTINYTGQDKLKAEKEIFNTIITSTGEEYTLQLSDGTMVHLNAESEIRFPVKFLKERMCVPER